MTARPAPSYGSVGEALGGRRGVSARTHTGEPASRSPDGLEVPLKRVSERTRRPGGWRKARNAALSACRRRPHCAGGLLAPPVGVAASLESVKRKGGEIRRVKSGTEARPTPTGIEVACGGRCLGRFRPGGGEGDRSLEVEACLAELGRGACDPGTEGDQSCWLRGRSDPRGWRVSGPRAGVRIFTVVGYDQRDLTSL